MYHSPGHAQWAGEQVEQRLTMAFHLNEGARNEKRSEFGSPDGYEWTCNVFVPDESQAILEDFFNHLMAENVRMTTKVIEPENEEGETEYLPSWKDIHHCFNGENLPCEQPYMTFSTEIPEPPSENPCDDIPEWDANEGHTNMAEGDLRKREVNGIWKVYKVKKGGLGFVHYDPSGPNGHYGWTYQYDCPA
jgi:hypothetical protein